MYAIANCYSLSICRQERQRYYSNRQLAIESSDETIILDGMDQNKTNVPHLVRVPKSCQNLWCLRTHLTGCVVHGVGNFGYFDFIQWPHDCNLTITTLLFTLANIAHNGYLPRRLLLQMDNCVRENKNKYVFGFLALLVEKKSFNEASMGRGELHCGTSLYIIISECTSLHIRELLQSNDKRVFKLVICSCFSYCFTD